MQNIKYGKVDSTDEEAMTATKVAEIHDQIQNFPDAYDTKVGERGMKLLQTFFIERFFNINFRSS